MNQQLVPADDHFFHQAPGLTMNSVATSDPNYRERMWCSSMDHATRELFVAWGMAQFPNRNVMEAWTAVTVGDRQFNTRGSRHLRPDIGVQRVGPFRLEIVEGLRTLRAILEPNDSGTAFDVTYETRIQPSLDERNFRTRNGVITHDVARMHGLTAGHGTVETPAGSFTVEPATFRGGRDHSWGIDSHTQEADVGAGMGFYFWLYAQFEELGIQLWLFERAPGVFNYISGTVGGPFGSDTPQEPVTSFEHDLVWQKDQPVHVLEGGAVRVVTASGRTYDLELRAEQPRFYDRTALYGGWRGWHQGDDKGPFHFEHDVWDLGDPVKVKEYAVHGGGIPQGVTVGHAGETGTGIIEYFVEPAYPKYQHLHG